MVGVQSGKTSVAGTLAVHAALTGEAALTRSWSVRTSRGALRALLRYAREPFESVPAFRAELVRETGDTLELRRGTSLSAYPCRPAALRGLRASSSRSTSWPSSPPPTAGRRTSRCCASRAAALATTGGKLIVLSSPYGQSGALWDLHRRHYGRDDSPTLVWQASAPAMNPTLSADYLQRMEQEDPEAYRSEVLGEFRAGISTFLDPDALADVVEAGVRERGPADLARVSTWATWTRRAAPARTRSRSRSRTGTASAACSTWCAPGARLSTRAA